MSAVSLRELLATGQIWHPNPSAGARPDAGTPPAWSFTALAGRYVELAARGPAARLAIAGQLALQAQLAQEAVAWVTSATSSFFPPDLADNGVDLDALVVVRVPTAQHTGTALLRAAETLLRAGAFGLVVLDLESHIAPVDVPLAVQSRLMGLAQHHDTVLLSLTTSDATPHALASLRAEVSLRGLGSGQFATTLTAVKDKRGSPGWQHEQVWRGVAGLG